MKKILFVCTGNICRSPAAETVFNALVHREGLDKEFRGESAGLMDYHIGERADSRMIAHARKRGYFVTTIARQFDILRHFAEFDLIVAMDSSHLRALNAYDKGGKNRHKIVLMSSFARGVRFTDVPDPYYGGPQEFELVLDLLEDACAGLIEKLRNENPSSGA